MSAVVVCLAKFRTGAPGRIVLDADRLEFDRVEPYADYTLNFLRAVESDGHWFTLSADCPDDGYTIWADDDVSPDEAAKESLLTKLTVDERRALANMQGLKGADALAIVNFTTRADRKAQKIIDDAEAEARAEAAKPKKEEE